MKSPAALVVASSLIVACGNKTATNEAATSKPVVSSSTPANSAPPPPPATPPLDFDVAAARAAVNCPVGAKAGHCGVLEEMSACKPYDAAPPGGDARFIGKAWTWEENKWKEHFLLVRVRTVPLDNVAPGQISAKVAFEDLEERFSQSAGKMVKTLSHHDPPDRANVALQHVTTREEWSEAFAVHTVNKQVYVISGAGAFLCTGSKQQLLVAIRSANRGSALEGTYAEVWPVTW